SSPPTMVYFGNSTSSPSFFESGLFCSLMEHLNILRPITGITAIVLVSFFLNTRSTTQQPRAWTVCGEFHVNTSIQPLTRLISIHCWHKGVTPVNDYYVYLLIDPRNLEVFYVGKGQGFRKDAHLKDKSDKPKAKRIK